MSPFQGFLGGVLRFLDPGLRSLHSLALGYVIPPRWGYGRRATFRVSPSYLLRKRSALWCDGCYLSFSAFTVSHLKPVLVESSANTFATAAPFFSTSFAVHIFLANSFSLMVS